MKTITEFDGFKLNQALAQFKEIMGVAKPAPKGPKAKIIVGKPAEAAPAAEAVAETTEETTPAEMEAASSAEAVETAAASEEGAVPSTEDSSASAEAAPAEASGEEKLKTALGEAYKMEGEKLEHFVNALKLIARKNQFLKRVLVMTIAEGEKAPQGAEKIGETHYFLAEYFPAPARKDDGKHQGPRDGKGRGDKRGKGKGKGGRGNQRGEKREGAGAPRGPGGPGRGPRPPKAENNGPAKPVALPQPRS